MTYTIHGLYNGILTLDILNENQRKIKTFYRYFLHDVCI